MRLILRSSVAFGILVIAGCAQAPAAVPPPPPAAPAVSPVERGKYLVNTSACHDCHTPAKMGPNGPEPDMERMLSGHPENVKVEAPKLPAGWLAATHDPRGRPRIARRAPFLAAS